MKICRGLELKDTAGNGYINVSVKALQRMYRFNRNDKFVGKVEVVLHRTMPYIIGIHLPVKDAAYSGYAWEEMLSYDSMPIFGGRPALSKKGIKLIVDTAFGNIGDGMSEGELIAMAAAMQVGYKAESEKGTPYSDYLLNKGGVPWCAILYHWCRKVAAAMKGHEVTFYREYSKALFTWEKAPYKFEDPSKTEPGDALIWSNVEEKGAGHLAICLENDRKRRMLLFVEGNYAEGIDTQARSYSRLTSSVYRFEGVCRYHSSDVGVDKKLFKGPGFGTPGRKNRKERNYEKD